MLKGEWISKCGVEQSIVYVDGFPSSFYWKPDQAVPCGCKGAPFAVVLKGGLFCCLYMSDTENRKAERNLRLRVHPQLQKAFVTGRKGHVCIIFL